MQEDTNRSLSIAYGLGFLAPALAYFLGGPYLASGLVPLGILLILRGYNPSLFYSKWAWTVALSVLLICSSVLFILHRRSLHPFANALSLSLISQPDFHLLNGQGQIEGLPWNDSYVYTTVTVSNSKDVDLTKVHIALETGQTFAEIKELTSLSATLQPSCPIPVVTSTWINTDGSTTTQTDTLGTGSPHENGDFITNGYDIYLKELPAHEYLSILLAATDIRGSTIARDNNGAVQGKRSEINYARVSGTYSAPINAGNADSEIYKFDLSTGQKPQGFVISSEALPNRLLPPSPHFLIPIPRCPPRPRP